MIWPISAYHIKPMDKVKEMRLSKHFTLNEMTKSQTASRRGIDNTPTAKEIENLRLWCHAIGEPVRQEFMRPVVVSSGFRSKALNKAIGGSTNSQHMTGEAVDFEVPGISNFEVARFIERALVFDQLILEFYTPGQPNSGWVHCSYLSNGKFNNRKMTLTAKKINGKTTYVQGLQY